MSTDVLRQHLGNICLLGINIAEGQKKNYPSVAFDISQYLYNIALCRHARRK